MRRMGEQEVRRGSRKVPLILSQATYAVDGNGRRLWRAGYWSGIDRDQAWRGNSQSHRRRDLVCSVGHLLHLASCAAERANMASKSSTVAQVQKRPALRASV